MLVFLGVGKTKQKKTKEKRKPYHLLKLAVDMHVTLTRRRTMQVTKYCTLSLFFSYVNASLWKYMEKHKVKQDSKAFQLVRICAICHGDTCYVGQPGPR